MSLYHLFAIIRNGYQPFYKSTRILYHIIIKHEYLEVITLKQTTKYFPILISILITLGFGILLFQFAQPMENISIDLSLNVTDDASIEDYNQKGWNVYIQEKDTITPLIADGYGSFTGLDLGQTFYFSREMTEEVDDPTLRIRVVECNIAIFLDNELIYTDCPECDNRIGYLNLPMNEWLRIDDLTFSLPSNYLGKTLTIAQSFPEYSEMPTVRAHPSEIQLYCGYAYESSIIAESFQTAFVAGIIFIIGCFLLYTYIQNQKAETLFIAMMAFLWMASYVVNTSFFYSYFSSENTQFTILPSMLSIFFIFAYLCSKTTQHPKLYRILASLYLVSVILSFACKIMNPSGTGFFVHLLSNSLPEYIGFMTFITIFLFTCISYKKESSYMQRFLPTSIICITLYWIYLIFTNESFFNQVFLSLQSASITYIYTKITYPVMIILLVLALLDAITSELNRFTEKKYVEERNKLILANYENLKQQHHEIMVIRHDMMKHFYTLKELSHEDPVTSYLTEIIGQNDSIRPILQSENEIMNIIINGKLSLASNEGIKVEMKRFSAPKQLPLSNVDLCSLLMNILDNAIQSTTGHENSFIYVDIHSKGNFLAIECENSIHSSKITKEENSIPTRGYGKGIIQNIVKKYQGMIEIEENEHTYKVQIVIPLS